MNKVAQEYFLYVQHGFLAEPVLNWKALETFPEVRVLRHGHTQARVKCDLNTIEIISAMYPSMALGYNVVATNN